MSSPPLVILTFLRPHQVTQKPRKQNQAFRAHETVDFKNLIFAFIFSAIGQNSKKCHFLFGCLSERAPTVPPKVGTTSATHTHTLSRPCTLYSEVVTSALNPTSQHTQTNCYTNSKAPRFYRLSFVACGASNSEDCSI